MNPLITAAILLVLMASGIKRGDTDVGYQPIKCMRPCSESFMGDWPDSFLVECGG